MADPIGDLLSKSNSSLVRKLAINDPLFASQRKGKIQAEKEQKKQKALIAEQTRIEKQRLASAESEVARRKAGSISSRVGRRSLIATSQSGLSQNLGGTAGG